MNQPLFVFSRSFPATLTAPSPGPCPQPRPTLLSPATPKYKVAAKVDLHYLGLELLKFCHVSRSLSYAYTLRIYVINPLDK